MMIPRRDVLKTLLTGAAIAALPGTSAAQAWPARPIRLLVPFPAGGSADISARLIADGLRTALGQGVVVENKVGAGGNLAAAEAARAEPDGHHLFVGTNGTQAINGSLYRSTGFDADKDFAPIAMVWESPNLLVVHPSLPVRSIADLVAYAKANPDKISFCSSGIGSATHLAAELFKAVTGAPMTHVPYRGQAPAIGDLIAGQTQVMFPLIPDILTHLQSGAVRALAVTAGERSALLPDIPTAAQAGMAGVSASAWIGLFAPRATPQPILDRLNAELKTLLGQEDFIKRLRDIGVEVKPLFQPAFADRIVRDRTAWSKLIADLNIKID